MYVSYSYKFIYSPVQSNYEKKNKLKINQNFTQGFPSKSVDL